MAKRWLTQKRLKQKKYRERGRGVMKRFSAERMTGGSAPNPEVMSWYKNSAKSLGYHIQPGPKELWYWNGNEPRREAIALKHKMMDTRPEWLYFRLLDDCFLRARMYFQHNPELCCVVELDKRTTLSRRSIIFRNRDVCHQRWLDNSIVWVEPDNFYHPNIPETFPPT